MLEQATTATIRTAEMVTAMPAQAPVVPVVKSPLFSEKTTLRRNEEEVKGLTTSATAIW